MTEVEKVSHSIVEWAKGKTFADVLEVMIEGLKNPVTKIDMSTFGKKEDGLCYGCAATNAVCQIIGVSDDKLNKLEDNFLADIITDYRGFTVVYTFEAAVDALRKGNLLEYNSRIVCRYSGTSLSHLKYKGDMNVFLPSLETDTYTQNLYEYEEFLKTLK